MKKLLMLALVAAFAMPMTPSFAAPAQGKPEAQSPSAGGDTASDESTGSTEKMTHKKSHKHAAGHKKMHSKEKAMKSEKTDGSESK